MSVYRTIGPLVSIVGASVGLLGFDVSKIILKRILN